VIAATFAGIDTVQVAPFDAIGLDLDALWGTAPPSLPAAP
jgi:hypothetical protein